MSNRKPASAEAVETERLDVTGQKDLRKIRKVNLSLHGDGINHWQDEPQPKPDKGGKAHD